MSSWYYIGALGQKGPLEEHEFKSLIASGIITGETPVWNSSLDNWLGFDQLPAPATSGPLLKMAQPEKAKAAQTAQATDYGRAEDTGPRHTCCQCQKDFPDKIMQPFGSDWICRHCRFQMIESAKARGQRKLENAFDFPTAAKRFGFMAFCLVFGTAVLVSKFDNYEALFTKRKHGLGRTKGLALLLNESLPEAPFVYRALPSGTPQKMPFTNLFFLVQVDNIPYAVTVISATQPAPVSESAPETEVISPPNENLELDIKVWDASTPSFTLSGCRSKPIKPFPKLENLELVVFKIASPVPAFPAPPFKLRLATPAKVTEQFTILGLDSNKLMTLLVGSAGPGMFGFSMGTIHGPMTAGEVLGAPMVDKDGLLSNIIVGIPESKENLHVAILEEPEAIAELIAQFPK